MSDTLTIALIINSKRVFHLSDLLSFFYTILTPFRGIEGHHLEISVVAAGWLGGIRLQHQVPRLLLPESNALPTELPSTTEYEVHILVGEFSVKLFKPNCDILNQPYVTCNFLPCHTPFHWSK